MLSSPVGKPINGPHGHPVAKSSDNFVTRKLWLPKLIYDALPYFYIVSGVAALLATLYISEWFWVLPHYLLFSLACVHLGVFVYRRRQQYTRRQRRSPSALT